MQFVPSVINFYKIHNLGNNRFKYLNMLALYLPSNNLNSVYHNF